MQADQLLNPEVPEVLRTQEEEVAQAGQWVSERATEGFAPHEIGVFARSAEELDRARSAEK
jgi:hypothetical protein